MKQRIVIAMALARSPELLIADLPTTALDVTIQAQVRYDGEPKHKSGASMLLITHDLGVVAEMRQGRRDYAGQLQEYGRIEHVFDETAHLHTKGPA